MERRVQPDSTPPLGPFFGGFQSRPSKGDLLDAILDNRARIDAITCALTDLRVRLETMLGSGGGVPSTSGAPAPFDFDKPPTYCGDALLTIHEWASKYESAMRQQGITGSSELLKHVEEYMVGHADQWATDVVSRWARGVRPKAALNYLINLNQHNKAVGAAEPVWKILIFDSVGKDIISPLLSLKDLRELGVTLNLSIRAKREPLPDVPSVYFVVPSDENIALIREDLSWSIYDSYYFNFISPLPREKLEEIATTAVQNSCVDNVKRIYDQYLSFISLEDDLFTLRKYSENNNLSYYGLSRGSTTESEMDSIINELADGLFCVCVTLGSVPIIRAPKGNAAEHVAERLDKRLRDNLRDARNNLFGAENVTAGQLNFQRPVLVVLDRSCDMATPLHHTWTYQALVHDVLNFEQNRVILEETTELGPKKAKEYYLSPEDSFWSSQKGKPFPEVAEAVQKELESYRNSEDEIKKLKHAMGLDAESDEAISMLSGTTEQLTSTVGSLPALLEKKRVIDVQTNVASAVLEHIKARKLDEFFEAEEKVMNHQSGSQLFDIIENENCGSLEDKLRIFLLAFICDGIADTKQVDKLEKTLESHGCNLDAVKYIKRWKALTKMSQDLYSGGGTKTVSMFSDLLNQSSQLVMQGVKNLVIKTRNLPITRIVDALMEQKNLPEVEDYRYFDPKLLRATQSSSMPRSRSQFNDAIVFVVGDGNYVEYQNLLDYAKAKSVNGNVRRITYGCSELSNPTQFLSQDTETNMADYVQGSLEGLIPVFEEVQRSGLLDVIEIKQIMKNCKRAEYKLEKRKRDKEDFIAYAQYLMLLLSLIKSRKAALGFKDIQDGVDAALVSKAENILRGDGSPSPLPTENSCRKRACVLFQTDERLWITRLELGKKRKSQFSVSKVFGRMLQVIKTKEELWILAAKFELDDNHSVNSARKTLQRAVRFLPQSTKIWLEMFRLELIHMKKIAKRRQILLNDKEAKTSEDAIMEGKLVFAVFAEAMKTLQKSRVALKFYQIANQFPREISCQVVQKITHYVSENLAAEEDGYDTWARIQFGEDNDQRDFVRAVQFYEDGMNTFESGSFWTMYINFCLEHHLDSEVEKLLEFGSQRKYLALEHYRLWLSITANDTVVVEKGLSDYPESVELWTAWIKLQLNKRTNDGSCSNMSVKRLLSKAMAHVEEHGAYPIWEAAVLWLAENHPVELDDVLQHGVLMHRNIADRIGLFRSRWLKEVDSLEKLYCL